MRTSPALMMAAFAVLFLGGALHSARAVEDIPADLEGFVILNDPIWDPKPDASSTNSGRVKGKSADDLSLKPSDLARAVGERDDLAELDPTDARTGDFAKAFGVPVGPIGPLPIKGVVFTNVGDSWSPWQTVSERACCYCSARPAPASLGSYPRFWMTGMAGWPG
jgi:hypothetical protein